MCNFTLFRFLLAYTYFLSQSTNSSVTLQMLFLPLTLNLSRPFFLQWSNTINAPEFTEYVSIFTAIFVHSSSEPEHVTSC